jgi:hypothetical protein
MAIWRWKMRYVDVRICEVEADTEEEAREKETSGDWLSEHTVEFYADELLEPMKQVQP